MGACVLVAVAEGLAVFVGAGVEVGVPGPVVVVGACVSVGESPRALVAVALASVVPPPGGKTPIA